MPKGSNYEREICKQLSKWWLGTDTDELIFWRSHGSGGWAHTRRNKGGETAGQHGDIAAIDPRGQAFLDVFATEIKRGHNKATLMDLFDRPMRGSMAKVQQAYDKWLEQTFTALNTGGSCTWMLIHRRDGRPAMVFISEMCYTQLNFAGAFEFGAPRPFITAVVPYTASSKAQSIRAVVGMLLDDFLENVSPIHVKKLAALS